MYRRCYANNGAVGYASDGDVVDHVFLCASANPGGEPATLTLANLVQRWGSKSGSGVTPRTLFFCQQFDLGTLPGILDGIDIRQHFGRLVYWVEDVFAGGAPQTIFPDGTNVPLLVGELAAVLVGPAPASLDAFTISADDRTGALTLAFATGTSCLIRRNDSDIARVNQPAFVVPLQSRRGFVAGGLSLSLDWPQGRDDDHPIRSMGFLFERAPERLPAPGQPGRCETWRAEFADEIGAAIGESCMLSLDPRDSIDTPQWLDGGANSRLEPGNALLHSSFFGTKGQRVHLLAGAAGVARLGFVFDRIFHDGSVAASDAIVFHPEGEFAIANPPQSTGNAHGIGPLDLIAGDAATEFFDLGGDSARDGVRAMHFSGGPAFLDDTDELLIDKAMPGDGKGRVITSFVSFVRNGRGLPVSLHSQPAQSALFAAAVSPTEPMPRRREAFGTAGKPMPVFPWAGHRAGAGRRAGGEVSFEITHLSKWRRQNVVPLERLGARDASPDRGVTPQGVLAEMQGGAYARLLLGNSDSANIAQAEFSLKIAGTGSPIFAEVQQALAGGQLFLVFDRPEPQGLDAIGVDPVVFIREFSFTLDLKARSRRSAATADRTVLLVKYFRGKTLQELVADPSLWGLRRHLAPAGDSEGIEALLHLDGDTSKPIPDHLRTEVWTNPDWQGVLLLDLPTRSMPPILEALQPGIVGSLRVHHFGLNAPAIKQADLQSDASRLGSAFGLIHYAKPADDPRPPVTDDREPGSAGPGARHYRFIVDALDVGFQNSQISSFNAKVRVVFDHLFWDPSRTRPLLQPHESAADANDDLTLFGSYEHRVKPGGGTEDVFSLRAEREYTVTFDADSRLDHFTIRRAQLSIVASERQSDQPSAPLKSLTAFIGVDGDLVLSETRNRILLFKVKAIHLKDFGFLFTYTPKAATEFTFGFKADGIAADLEFDPPAGTSSLLELLPVKLKGMSVAIGKLFELSDLGFQPISFDGVGTGFHFAFVLELDLGFIGRLAGDMRGLRVPLLLGWRGGASKGVALGIQFPTFNGKIDIGIQQFIRLRADSLNLVPCPAPGTNLKAIAIQAVNLKVVMLGREWPDEPTSLCVFVPVHASRRASWAVGVKPAGSWLEYLGGGQRITLAAGSGAKGTKDVVASFEQKLTDASQPCALLDLSQPDADGWSVVAKFKAGVEAWLAIDDAHGTYGLVLKIPVLGEIDVLYRRINDQLGIFSAEYTLPDELRTIQIGVASVRLPTFRIEVHTDGGALFDFGFPWRNDFSRSCQVEVGIFVGSGGFYYGRTSAAATDLLRFDGGYGFLPPDESQLTTYRALRLGFALRVGIGRSFSIGILSAEASLTIFGGVEGAAAYPGDGGQLFAPTLYALRGFVGLMLDIRAEVNFAIIRARARLLAYVMVGLEIRRVLARRGNQHFLVKLPTVIFAEVGLTVQVDVEISIGCVSITIHLSFSATWRLEETIGSLEATPPPLLGGQATSDRLPVRPAARPDWNTRYRFWTTRRELNLFVTVLPCTALASDVGLPGERQTCVVGQMLLPVRPAEHGFADYAKFLTGWMIAPDSETGIPDDYRITLAAVTSLRAAIRTGGEHFWDGFEGALLFIVDAQFDPVFNRLSAGQAADPFATLPLWPQTEFGNIRTDADDDVPAAAHFVVERGEVSRGPEAGFANYSSCMILGFLAEIEQLVTDEGRSDSAAGDTPRNDPNKFLEWGEIWTRLLAPLVTSDRYRS